MSAADKNGASPSQSEINLFVLAGGTGNHNVLKSYIQTYGKEWLNVVAASGLTALGSATYCGRVETAELLLNAGADIDGVDNHGQSALHSGAVGALTTEILSFLLMRGANIDLKDKKGRTALMLAEEHQRDNVAEVLTKWSLLQQHLRQERQKNITDASTAKDRIELLKKKKPRKPAFQR